MTFKGSNLNKKKMKPLNKLFGKEETLVVGKLVTCKPVAALKTETVFPVQTRSFFASLEKEGGDVRWLLPPRIMAAKVEGEAEGGSG